MSCWNRQNSLHVAAIPLCGHLVEAGLSRILQDQALSNAQPYVVPDLSVGGGQMLMDRRIGVNWKAKRCWIRSQRTVNPKRRNDPG
jgi:hypothetical protein